ncbi:retrotransposon protein, putative, ty1-copia subclass [Tanacetum coccineum]
MESPRENPYLPDKVPIYAESYISAFIHLGLASRVCNSAFSLVPTKKVDKTPYELWYGKMMLEIQSMMDNMVWVLVYLPPGCKTVGSKWLFKKKTDMNGIVHVYKARLVTKEYENGKWLIKNTFLNGYLDEDIYMVQPKGFVDPNHPRKVCKLQRSIYGLKQASRSWNKRFDEEIKRFRFAQNLDEPCVYQKASGSNVTFLILYVDDIIIMGNHISSLQSVKDYLGKCFAMKDLGEAAFILGIKIYRDRSKRLIRLGQNAYMDKILKRYKMDNSKRGHIPMQERIDLNKTQGASTPKEVKRMQNVLYASANPGECHWTTVKNILKYLRNTKDMFLVYGGNLEAELRVDCYCNAGFETDIDDMKSLTGYKGTRHYHRRYHYVRESIALGEIRFLKVYTDDNLADPFTKALPKGKLTQHARSMGLRLASSFM